ncbi:hypothetical protein CT694_33940 (plasmid) [Bacillus wiedmannii bv. thuringiensis]|nr:hypothetical protein CT694_33940 [Bacillus wiedmannii bv. thuringiensis]
MNSYQNKNEYEILDASRNNSNMSNRYPRYPLANDPQASMQNTNYKDWLNMCEGTPVPSSSYSQLLKVAGGVVSRALGMLPIPGVAPLLSFLSTLLWPSASEGNTIWEDMMKYVADLIQQELTDYTIRQATVNLAGLKELLQSYNSSLASWLVGNATPELVRGYMGSLHRTFLQDIIGSFTISGYEKILLPTYVIAANFHLLLLRDIEIYGKRLGFAQKDLDFYNCELKRYMAQYTNYCVDTYNKGLASEKEKSWVHFHRYRRTMTLAVLDIIALFPMYDARLYPATDSKIQVKSELTREIYSDVINGNIYGLIYSDNNRNEELYTRPPHLFTWLRGFRFVTNSISAGNITWTFLAGNQNKYSSTTGSGIITGPFYGQDTNYGGTSSNIDIPAGSYVYNLWTKNYEFISPYTDPINITRINFSITNNNSSSEIIYGGDRNMPTVRTDFDFLTNKDGTASPTYNNYNHILSYMLTNGTFGQKRHGYTFSFTHSSVDPYNGIDPDKVTQIPAVKANYPLGLPSSVIKGPGHTGGDLVVLRNYGDISWYINFAKKVKRYRIRLRYASNSAAQMALAIGGTGMIYFDIAPTIKSGHNETNLALEDFQVMYTPIIYSVFEDTPTTRMSLYSMSNTASIILDKIEFVPIDIPIDKCTKCQFEKDVQSGELVCICRCEGVQSLDTEKEIINSLFVE